MTLKREKFRKKKNSQRIIQKMNRSIEDTNSLFQKRYFVRNRPLVIWYHLWRLQKLVVPRNHCLLSNISKKHVAFFGVSCLK